MLLDMNNDGQVDIVTSAVFPWNCDFAAFAGLCARLLGPTALRSGPGTTWTPGPKAYPHVQYRSTAIDDKSRVLHDTTVSRVFRTPEQQGRTRDPRTVQSAQFNYQASDGAATSAPAIEFVKIVPDNKPPVFTSTPPRAAHQRSGVINYYDVAAYDPDPGDTINYSLKNTPPGVSIDMTTGRVRFEPACSNSNFCASGWTTVTVVATDSRGAMTEQFFLINLTTVSAVVPNVVGQLFDPAIATLRGANLDGRQFSELNSTQPVGTVLAQSPAAGVSVGEFEEILLTVSKGPAPVIVPNVVDLAETLALTRLNAAGFNVTVTTQLASALRGTVISQSLSAGSTVVPGAMSIGVSGGTGLELKLSQIVISGGQSLNLLPAAFDASGVPAVLPTLTYSVVAKQLPILGTLPTVGATTLSSTAATLGSFTVTATDSVGGRSASADFVVLKTSTLDGKTNGAVIANMLSVLTQMEALAPAMRTVRAANDTAQMRTLLTQYVTIWRTVDVARMKLTVPISLPVGFVPSEAEMTAFGVSPQPEDFLIQQILNEASDDLRAWTAGLRASGTSLADLRTLADTFSTRAARIDSLAISEYGGVMNHPQMIQLIGHDIPEFYEALTDELAVVVGLPRRAPDYPSFKRARTDQKSTLAEVLVTLAVDMVIDKVMDRAAQTYKNAKKFAVDTMGFAAYSSAILATYTHLKDFAYGKDLEEVVSGASLSFRVFNSGYSFIEVATSTRRRPMFTVMVIGPSLFTDAAAGIKATIDKLKDAMSYGTVRTL